ncbi:hypothetical protein [Moorena sp. SIO4G3]|uniref:hypothetical protein n=1 Tax=Moorena sp. SIO4G3 TaxID=2607821 RepID=UPI001429EB9A|nr:hypothetical protein [Moorena sp. SIO4G3]NEO74815.1 hypothetical protein [Moorena sp. SIO4G3]
MRYTLFFTSFLLPFPSYLLPAPCSLLPAPCSLLPKNQKFVPHKSYNCYKCLPCRNHAKILAKLL